MSATATTHSTIEFLDRQVRDAERRNTVLRDQLRDGALLVAEQLQKLARDLDNGLSPNEQGEIRANGPEIDRLCALVVASGREVVQLRYIAEQVAEEAGQ